MSNKIIKKLKVAVICGGPSSERGISLNSARSVCDHLEGQDLEVYPFYFDLHYKPFKLSRAQLYSNTPSDFDFKLAQIGGALTTAQLIKELRKTDLVFPAMHGKFGEDGQIQGFLEKNNIAFVGGSSEACQQCFDKYLSNQTLKEIGFKNIASCLIEIKYRKSKKLLGIVKEFFNTHKVNRAVVKPAVGGSSIGVYSVTNVKQALEKIEHLFATGLHSRLVIEPFCEGIEFTSIILENKFGLPVCLLPVEIEADYFNNQIFDYRKKYLPTRQVSYHCPARFSQENLDLIATKAEALFKHFGLRDFARFDGWLLKDGSIYFSDFNPISGMEQNSFLFLQSSRIGMSHRDVLRYVVERACSRNKINWKPQIESDLENKKSARKKVAVLFGGSTAERQVSLMSGTNVWLKLRASKKFQAEPYFLDSQERVWHLPYGYALNHTVEEILHNCENAEKLEKRLLALRNRVKERLFLDKNEASLDVFVPKSQSITEFFNQEKYVFLGLHGGIGENGKLQSMLKKRGVNFNGSGPEAAQICMDKVETGIVIERAGIKGVHIPKKFSLTTNQLAKYLSEDLAAFWNKLKSTLSCDSLIIKPQDDGCSAGVARLFSVDDLRHYLSALLAAELRLAAGTLKGQDSQIEMPTKIPSKMLFEEFIETDKVEVVAGKLKWQKKSGIVEVTVGVIGKKGRLKALSPSITVASGNVLSLEEKFQGGTGVNITPPPIQYVSQKVINLVKERVEAVANALGIENYARLDTFINIKTAELYFIEANTLPGLTPSTVLYHQALAEKVPLYPRNFLEKIVELSSK